MYSLPNIVAYIDTELLYNLVLQWKPKECQPSVLQVLMQRHDLHHRAFKKFVAQNKPLEYQVADKLLSYAGFVR